MNHVDILLSQAPYGTQDRSLFVLAMHDALRYHYHGSHEFKKFIDFFGVDVSREYAIEEFPFLPIGVFKELELVTGSKDRIKKKIHSSSTSGNAPSVICLDQVTIDRQRLALSRIMGDVIGKERSPFFLLDTKETVQAVGEKVSSRGSAIRGFLPFANSTTFLLRGDLSFDDSINISDLPDSMLFGFTWVVYSVMQHLKERGRHLRAQRLLHIGGWKKLRDMAVTKEAFTSLAEEVFGIPKGNVTDIYGMTEQLGTVYPDCQAGYKHVPLYSDVLARNPKDLCVQPIDQSGLLQFLTPLPMSYPGISILTDDVGKIVGNDGCSCGRRGKYFVFEKRHEEAELKGCGDTL